MRHFLTVLCNKNMDCLISMIDQQITEQMQKKITDFLRTDSRRETMSVIYLYYKLIFLKFQTEAKVTF